MDAYSGRGHGVLCSCCFMNQVLRALGVRCRVREHDFDNDDSLYYKRYEKGAKT